MTLVFIDVMYVNLEEYIDDRTHYLYLSSGKGWEVHDDVDHETADLMLFARFMLSERGAQEFYIMAKSTYTPFYNSQADYYKILSGIVLQPRTGLHVTTTPGVIKYSGINRKILDHPDLITCDFVGDAPLRYITQDNRIDWNTPAVYEVVTNKLLDYENKVFKDIPEGKWSVQRWFYDVHHNCLCVQYADKAYIDLDAAIADSTSDDYPFIENKKLYLRVGDLYLKSGATDLTDKDSAIFVKNQNQTNDDNEQLVAIDILARNKAEAAIEAAGRANDRLDVLEEDYETHKNALNPHKTSTSDLVNGNDSTDDGAYTKQFIKDNYWNKNEMKDEYLNRKTSTDQTVKSKVTFQDSLYASKEIVSSTRVQGSYLQSGSNYIIVGGRKVFFGGQPNGANNGDMWFPY